MKRFIIVAMSATFTPVAMFAAKSGAQNTPSELISCHAQDDQSECSESWVPASSINCNHGYIHYAYFTRQMGPCDPLSTCPADLSCSCEVDDEDLEIFLEVWQDVCGPIVMGDINGSGGVGVADLLILLANYGPCDKGMLCLPDLNNDGVVNAFDVLILLSNWTCNELPDPYL